MPEQKVIVTCEIREKCASPLAFVQWKWPATPDSFYGIHGREIIHNAWYSCYVSVPDQENAVFIIGRDAYRNAEPTCIDEFKKFCDECERHIIRALKQWNHVLSMRRAFKVLDDIEVNKKGESESCQ